MTSVIKKEITVAKHNFRLEIYPHLLSNDEVSFEIFPRNYKACLYAFSNKNKIDKIIRKNYIYEPKK